MLVSLEIDISNAEHLIFSYTASSGESEIGFGAIDDPSNPDSFEEVQAYFPPGDFIEYQYDLSSLPTQLANVHFAWKHKISTFSWVSMDYLILTEFGVSVHVIASLRNVEIYPNSSNEKVNIRLGEEIESVSI
jgi:hypothetical protein